MHLRLGLSVPRKKVPFGVAKPISKVWIPIFPPNRHLRDDPFRRDKFSPENGFNIGRLESIRPLIVVVAQ